ncbi:hypothetical protein V1259_16340 [Zafaria sp. J156]|nr:hypothetical protein [Zafaria sp. J156]MEE1622930.1 hypothetical protein [Zafaria sp. J156]
MTAHITPRIGDLAVAEAKPDKLQKFLTTVHREAGHGAAKNCRSTLSGMMALAVRSGAIARNPIRDLERITQPKGKKGASAIALEELPGVESRIVV